MEAPDADRYLTYVSATLGQVHEMPAAEVLTLLRSSDAVMSIHVTDRMATAGTMPLPKFEALVTRLRRLLFDAAAFVLTDSPVLEGAQPSASYYVSECRFLQTRPGSYVASVQLPSRQLLEPSLPEALKVIESDTVADTLESFLRFALQDVLGDRALRADQENPFPIPSIDLFRDLAEILTKTGADRLEFTFARTSGDNRLSTDILYPWRLRRLREYIKLLKAEFQPELEIVAEGRIVELRSREMRAERNHVVLEGTVNGLPALAMAALNMDHYFSAIGTHREAKRVRIVGLGRRRKGNFAIRKVSSFSVL
jgi:hypothetical protein